MFQPLLYRVLLTISMIISFSHALFADAAGILPYSYLQNGTAYFLFGYESSRGWTDFGGKCDAKDHVQNDYIATAQNAATREFLEESLMLYQFLTVLPLVKKAQTDGKFINHTFSNQSKYCMFCVNFENCVARNSKIGLLEAADFRSELQKLKNNKGIKWLKSKGAEKEDFVRVSAQEFLSVLKDIKSGKVIDLNNLTLTPMSIKHKNAKLKIWPTFARMLKANIDHAIKITTDIVNHK